MADFRPERRFTRIDRLPPYVFNITAELKMAARRRGEDIIDFSMGNPDGATPPHIVEKLCTVAQRPDTHGYSTSRGIPRLRRAISHWYQERYDVDIDPETEAIVTIGSKEGLAHLMLATLDHGDTVSGAEPQLPDSYLWRRYRRGAGAFGSIGRGGGFLQRAGARYSRKLSETENDDFGFSI
ncbi:aminotransferase [Salmonella enterica subsp. enterica]|uniref:Aminotransferase n=1 Tax=Salmonella enterica I TaxID=59201 RepID=A0A447TYP9_SALET|nr:aminotransferase [Salmonella enterica subsp. enterica]